MKMTLQEAFQKVAELGRDGLEHAIVLGGGRALAERKGDEHSICLKKEIEAGLIGPNSCLVHNHPNEWALSLQDIYLAHFQRTTVFAVASDGSVYWSKGFSPEFGGLLTAEDCDLLNGLSASVKSHGTNVMLRNKGGLDYHFCLSQRVKSRLIVKKMSWALEGEESLTGVGEF